MLINIKNLTYSYPGSYSNVFENVSFQIDSDWKLGFIGRNGRGKTTFMKILTGEIDCSGSIHTDIKFTYFPFQVSDGDKYTIDIIKEIAEDADDWKIYKEASIIGLSDDVMYREYSTLSNGEQIKSMLIGLFLRENNFLLFDEPTNHLDYESRISVRNYLSSKKGFILVSHDRDILDHCVDHIISINRENIEVQKGNYSSWYDNKRLQDEFEIKKNESLKKEISRLEKSFNERSKWSDKVENSKTGVKNSGSKIDRGYVGHMAAKSMRRAKNIESRKNRAIEEKTSLLKNIDSAEPIKLIDLEFDRNPLIRITNLNISYENKVVIKDVSFDVERGDRISIKGKNGSGKSTLIKAILSKYKNNKIGDFDSDSMKISGNIRIPNDLIVSYVCQDTGCLSGSLSEYVYRESIDETLFKSILRKLDFSREMFDVRMENMSEGQKKKVVLAGSISKRAHIYIWDEPLNYIDIISKIQIEDMIKKYSPTMIFVEHDIVFNKNIATKVIELD